MAYDNLVLKVLHEQVSLWNVVISLMESGKVGTHEVRDGRTVDTTEETIADRKLRVLEFEKLIAKIEKHDA